MRSKKVLKSSPGLNLLSLFIDWIGHQFIMVLWLKFLLPEFFLWNSSLCSSNLWFRHGIWCFFYWLETFWLSFVFILPCESEWYIYKILEYQGFSLDFHIESCDHWWLVLWLVHMLISMDDIMHVTILNTLS